jgi:hypothetical protein
MPERPRTGWRFEGVTQEAIPSVDLGAEGRWPGWYRALPPELRKWAPPATMAAVAISVVIHGLLWVIAAVVIVGGVAQAGGAGGGDQQGVGVAIMTEAELGELIGGAAIDADAPAVAEAIATTLPGSDQSLHVSDALVGDLESGGLGDGLGDLVQGLGAGDVGSGSGLGVGGAGGGAASFFGVEARGNRFAYIVDVSGSMDMGVGAGGDATRLTILKNELRGSVDALMDNAFFFIATFSDDAKALGGKVAWTVAAETGKVQARRMVSNLVSEGATIPLPAFRMVFALRPRPDAIYFMTDGEFDKDQATMISRMNAEFRIPIHCITFASKEGEEVMRWIAAESGGTYTHVPGPSR